MLVHGRFDAQGNHDVRELLILLAELDEGADFVLDLAEDVGLLEQLRHTHVRVREQVRQVHAIVIVVYGGY